MPSKTETQNATVVDVHFPWLPQAPDRLSIAGNAASVLGLIISCYTLIKIFQIKGRMFFRDRVASILRGLRELSGEIRMSLKGDFASEALNTRRNLEQVVSLLKHLSGNKVGRWLRIYVTYRRLQLRILLSRTELNEQRVRVVYTWLDGLIVDIEQQLESNQWEIENG